MSRTIRIGIFGLGRGSGFYEEIAANNGEIVAVCDSRPNARQAAIEHLGDRVTAYDNFDEFIEHPMDAVFLANYFHEHASYAIRALEKNIHVLSECSSNGTMADGVALVRAAEKSKAIYMLSENYPFMSFNQEMKRVYDGGTLGKILYAEGEYNHPIDWYDTRLVVDLRPNEKHWRNWLPRTYYVTHSLAPLMYATGSKPVRVTAMPVYAPLPEDCPTGGHVADIAAVVTTLNDDNSVFKFTGCAAFGAHGNSYRLCCEKGQIENIRGYDEKVSLRYNHWQVPEGMQEFQTYDAEWHDDDAEAIENAGHGGGDFFVIRKFFESIRNQTPPPFDVYFATRMASVAILGHRSMMERGVPYDIPDFRNEADRKAYENDTLSPFWGSDGSAPTYPCCSNPGYAPSDAQRAAYQAEVDSRKQ
ncbi:MAG: Gfo/Idh/MocA family oxidoreductase [Clostridia bacterium]|nr:Gfo/Idh/MocA family oxidoreductase [Clostridia bacterium]